MSPKKFIFNLFAGLLGFCHAGPLAGQTPDINAAISDLQSNGGLMGISVVTFCGDAITGSYHHGLRDFELGLPVTASTSYRMASVSKAATAVACMRLVEAGLLDLDADCSGYLGFPLVHPNFPGVVITPRMLLSHTSGLRDGTGYGGFLAETTDGDVLIPPLDALVVPGGAYHTANVWGSAAPGTYFQYSNLNFGVLATVMEAAAFQRFDLLMTEWVLAPLGCTGGFNVATLEGIADLAVLYRNQGGWTAQADDFGGVNPPAGDWGGYVPGTNGLLFGPQGGLRISAEEMARIAGVWGDGSWNGVTLLQPASVAAMHGAEWTFDGGNGNNYYGLFQGWGLGLHRAGLTATDALWGDGTQWVGHPGEAYGLISDAYVDAARGWGFVFATNGSWNGFSVGETAWYTLEEQVFAAIAPDWAACGTSVGVAALGGLTSEQPGHVSGLTPSPNRLAPNPGRGGDGIRWVGPSPPVPGERVEWRGMDGRLVASGTAGEGGLLPAAPAGFGLYRLFLPATGRSLPWVGVE